MPVGKVVPVEVIEGKKIASRIDYFVSNRFISQEDADHSMTLKGDAKYKALSRLAKEGISAKTVDFKGHIQTAHVAKRASAPTKTAHEVQSDKVATWLRRKLSEGSAGQEVGILLSARFNQNVLDDHNERIASVRTQHEGLSGHVYVDAGAYMTKGGTEGCDKGSLVHRANQIPTVLNTAKCGSCVFNSGGSCQKYNKVIISSVEEVVENPESFQKENVRLANASDSEKTASLFTNNYDPDEFGLTANGDVSVDEQASNEQIANVLFGGFEV